MATRSLSEAAGTVGNRRYQPQYVSAACRVLFILAAKNKRRKKSKHQKVDFHLLLSL